MSALVALSLPIINLSMKGKIGRGLSSGQEEFRAGLVALGPCRTNTDNKIRLSLTVFFSIRT